MERLAILDHANHRLYIEDVSDEDLAYYDGEEEKYIEDNYTFESGYSWEYITDIEYLREEDKTPMDIDIDNFID